MSNDNKAIQDTTFNTNADTPEYLTKVNELCKKVAENPERHEAFLMQDDVGYIIPVSRILEITAEKHKQEIAEKDAEIAKRDALIKEMSDLLTKVNDVEYVDVTAWFDGCVDAEQQEWLDSAIDAIHKCQLAFDGIIAKAREAVNG